MQPLFLESPVEFEKTAAETALSEDPNAWPQEVLQELYKQAPYIADFSPHVVMEKVDGEQGYGLGHVEVSNQTETQMGATPESLTAAGIRQVRVPVVIKDGMLSPFDLLVSDDSKVLPLTEVRLRAAIFRPQPFDVTSRTPGDQSMIGQLYPPYRQSYGFGGGGVAMNTGMGKEGSALEQYLLEGKEKTAGELSDVAAQFMDPNYLHAPDGHKQGRYGKKMATVEGKAGALDDFIAKNKTASVKGAAQAPLKKTGSVLGAILPTIRESDLNVFKQTISDPDLQPLIMKNAAALTAPIQALVTTEMRKQASISEMINPTVVQLRVTDEGYRVKTASHLFWDPVVQNIDRGEAIRRFGEKVVLAADLSGAATLADGAEAMPAEEGLEHDSDMQDAGPIAEAGLYKVQTQDGQEAVGYVIPNLIDIDGTPLPLALFTNGTQSAVQTDMVGSPVEGAPVELPSADAPSGHGVFACEGPDGLQATVPLTVSGSIAGGEGEPGSFMAKSFSGEETLVSLQPNIQTVVGAEGKMLIPEHWTWVPLSQSNEIVLESQETNVGKEASAKRALESVELVSGGGTFSVRGHLVEKLAHDDREFLSVDEAMFLLAGLGVDQGHGVKKLAEALSGERPVQVRVGRSIKLASNEMREATERARETLQYIPALKQQLFKEAAVISDPAAVDTVLSLGFLNPENVTTFISYLPVLEDAQSKLCDILLASRLGSLIDTPEGAVERAVRSLEATLEGLKALAFQTN